MTLFNQGRFTEAEVLARDFTERYPHHGFGWKALGAVLQLLGRTPESLEIVQRAVILLPSDAEAKYNLGITLKELNRLKEAEAGFRRALEIKPDYAEAHCSLGMTLHELGRLVDAEASYRRALELNPKFAEAHNNLGNTFKDLGQSVKAEAEYRRALEIKTDYAEAHNNLGNILMDLGKREEAETCFRCAIAINPDSSEAHCNLGNTLMDLGRLDGAEVCYRRALEIKPDFCGAQGNLLFCLNYSLGRTAAAGLEEARKYGQIVTKLAGKRFADWPCQPNPEHLRVGMVSGDLRSHPVGYFLESLLAKLDRTKVELIAFSTHAKTDELTARIKPYFADWQPLFGLNDEAAAHLIHSKGVHILIDLSGHTSHNRLPVFAWKAAPVQVSWLGFLATAGVTEIDYLLGDPHVTPPEDDKYYSESVWRLPEVYCCFTQPDVSVDVSSLPALTAGCITFGCFNNLAKINDAVVALWARILSAVPGSRLFLKTKQLNDLKACDTIRQRFVAKGIEPGRLILEGASPRAELLASYNRVDIALDPYPYGGATTSVEALWMAVPFITRKGDRFLSRCGQTLACNAGLSDWIAENDDDYVAKAIAHSQDLKKLAALRNNLRQQVLDSPLFDAPRFAKHLEEALWEMWRLHEHANDIRDKNTGLLLQAATSAVPLPACKPIAAEIKNQTDSQKPASAQLKKILCVEAANWVGIERLAIHLNESGFAVGCLCTEQSVLNKISQFTLYNWTPPVIFNDQLEQAINSFKPDLLIFMDDPSFRMIGKVIDLNPNNIISRHKQLLEKSLGNLNTVSYRLLRRTLAPLQEHVLIPKTMVSNSVPELSEFGATVGWQAFFKEEFTCSGMGVIATDSERMFLQTARRLLDEGKMFIVQEFIHGITAMRAAVAFEGKVLSGISFNKITSASGGIGYSTVVMPVQNEVMRSATEKIGELLKINGPFSCDFILDDSTGAAYLIEINPRPTTVFHLGHLFGVSFASSFESIIDGAARIQFDIAPVNNEVALFPKELFRDRKSPRLTTAFHDVPWEYPGIVAHYLSLIAGEKA